MDKNYLDKSENCVRKREEKILKINQGSTGRVAILREGAHVSTKKRLPRAERARRPI